MSRKKKIDRPTRLEVLIPESIASKMKLELYSEVEGKVPHGVMSSLVSELIRNWLVNDRGVQC